MNEEEALERSTLGRLANLEIHFALMARVLAETLEQAEMTEQAKHLDDLMLSFLTKAHSYGSRVNEIINMLTTNKPEEDG